MNPALIGPALGEAACHAEDASRALIRMAIRLDLAGLEITDEVAEVVETVADLSAAMLQLADDFGHVEISRLREEGAAA